MDQELLPTAPVGSYPQPDWLIDRSQLLGHGPPRVRARGMKYLSRELAFAKLSAMVEGAEIVRREISK